MMTAMRARGRLAPGLHRDGKVTGLWLNVGGLGNKSWVLRYTLSVFTQIDVDHAT